MSGALSVPNTFANAVTATGLQLDTNFNTVTAYINDPTNRNNYAAYTSGSTNTIALSFNPAVTGYSTGLEITFKAALGNTGAVVVNANSLGNKNLFSPAGVALSGGEITASQIIKAVYDGAQFQMISQAQNVFAASAATVSQAISNAFFVTPGRMRNHPGVAKAWAHITATYGIAGSAYNVASVAAGSTGTCTVVFTTPMADTNYVVLVSTTDGGGFGGTASKGTGTVVVFLAGTGGAAVHSFDFTVYGNQ